MAEAIYGLAWHDCPFLYKLAASAEIFIPGFLVQLLR
jgi:hypothetical protein